MIRNLLTNEPLRHFPTNHPRKSYVDCCSVSILFAVLTDILVATRIATFKLAHVTRLSCDWHVMVRTFIPVLGDDLKLVLFEQVR
jgi:hypothetical protein